MNSTESPAYFQRRYRKRREQDSFDRGSFRRSAVVLSDPPTHADTVERGFNPRPPTMIERKLANTPPASPQMQQQFNHMYAPTLEHGQQQYQYGPASGYGHPDAYLTPSFVPGQVLANASPAPTPTSAQPLFSTMQQGPSPFSPVASPIAPLDTSRESPIRQASNEQVLKRQSSGNVSERRSLAGTVTGTPEAHYLDLSRSSVSPFQAAQYAAISRTLDEFPLPEPFKMEERPSIHVERSFEQSSVPVPPSTDGPSTVIQAASPNILPVADAPASAPEAEEHAAPSSNGHDITDTPHPRVDSTPPVLPEIGMHQRTFSPTPFSSPFDSTMPVSGQSQNETSTALATTVAPTSTVAAATAPAQRRDTAYTLFDPNDAYGGI